MPSGVLTPGCVPVIGNGVVVDPKVLLSEIDGLAERGVDTSTLLHLGRRAPDHAAPPGPGPGRRALPRARPRIGTTGRGIGPAYGDKVARMGIRVQDLLDPGILRKKLELVLREKNQILVKVYNRKAIDADDGGRGVPRRTPSGCAVHRRHPADAGQGAGARRDRAAGGRPGHPARRRPRHLSVRHLVEPDRRRRLRRARASRRPGSTRSSASSRRTRPGSAPARSRPSCSTRTARTCARSAREYGTTTGRERRCGWFDAVVARYAVRVNGITDLVVTKLDVLSGLEKVPICVGVRDRRRARRRDADDADRVPPRHARSTRSCTAGGRTSPSAAPRPSCRRTPAATSSASRSCAAPGSASSAWAPVARRTSSATTLID